MDSKYQQMFEEIEKNMNDQIRRRKEMIVEIRKQDKKDKQKVEEKS